MNSLLVEHGVWMPFSGRTTHLKEMLLRIKKKKAHSFILLSLSNEVISKLASEDTTKIYNFNRGLLVEDVITSGKKKNIRGFRNLY